MNCVCFIPGKLMSLHSDADFELRPTSLMLRPSHGSYSVARLVQAMCEVELITAYRESGRLHTQLTDEVQRYRNAIHAELSVIFPEFMRVFADPCRPTALAVLQLYPGAQAIARASVETLAATLRELAPRRYGEST